MYLPITSKILPVKLYQLRNLSQELRRAAGFSFDLFTKKWERKGKKNPYNNKRELTYVNV